MWEAWWLLAEMRRSRVRMDVVDCSAAIGACAGDGRHWQLSLALLFQSLRGQPLKANVVSFGAAAAALERGRQWVLALQLLGLMRAEALSPDAMTFHALVRACSKANEWKQAWALLTDMRSARLRPHLIAHNAALGACVAAHLWVQALAHLARWRQEAQVRPDAVTFNSVMAACAASHCWQQALALLREQRLAQLQPDVAAYGATLEAAAGAGLWELSLFVFQEMRFENIAVPDQLAFGAAIRAFGLRGALRWREAMVLLSDMVSQSLHPDLATVVAAAAACEGAGHAPSTLLLDGIRRRIARRCDRLGGTPRLLHIRGFEGFSEEGASAQRVLHRRALVPLFRFGSNNNSNNNYNNNNNNNYYNNNNSHDNQMVVDGIGGQQARCGLDLGSLVY
ncbi:unnamed protein product, partial [Polarella glacialis]